MKRKKWYDIQAQAADGDASVSGYEIRIHGDIGAWGVSARDFIAEFSLIPADAPITLSVHSYGGQVFDALAIYHVLARERSRVTARVEGIAASSASLVIMAAGSIEIPANAFVMIHNPANFAVGDYKDLREMADVLKKLHDSFAAIYAERAGMPVDEVGALMDAETWYTGTEAVAAGFADVELVALAAAARLSEQDAARFAHAPEALAPADEPDDASHGPDAAPTPSKPVSTSSPTAGGTAASAANVPIAMAADEVADACVAAGQPGLAAVLIKARANLDTVTRRLDEATQITALARAAGRIESAQDLVLAGVSVESARATLMAARASGAPLITPHAQVDARASGEGPAGSTASKRLDFRSIYSRRKAAITTA